MFYKVDINKDLVASVPDSQKDRACIILLSIHLGSKCFDNIMYDDKFDILNILACEGIISRNYDTNELQLEKDLFSINQKNVDSDLIEQIRTLWLKKSSGYANISLNKRDTAMFLQKIITEKNWNLNDIHQICINYISECKINNVRPRTLRNFLLEELEERFNRIENDYRYKSSN